MKILLGMTGSVATILYRKMVDELSKIGEVKVILTKSAEVFADYPTQTEKDQVYTDFDEWCWYDSKSHPKHNWVKGDRVLHTDLS